MFRAYLFKKFMSNHAHVAPLAENAVPVLSIFPRFPSTILFFFSHGMQYFTTEKHLINLLQRCFMAFKSLEPVAS